MPEITWWGILTCLAVFMAVVSFVYWWFLSRE